jgi:hypothetical protein
MGSREMFLGKRNVAKTTSELIFWNKDITAKYSVEVRKASDNPSIDWLLHFSNMYHARNEFGAFLEQACYANA